jgi:hypothetical protein
VSGPEGATPGPWEASPVGFKDRYWISVDVEDVATVWECEGDRGEANARLIAAAPELYSAVTAALDLLDNPVQRGERLDGEVLEEVYAQLCNAQQKAEGRES